MSDPATQDSVTPDSVTPDNGAPEAATSDGAVPLWVLSLAGALALVILVGVLTRNGDSGSSPAEPIDPVVTDEVEVCDTTEYEGCPARWEYLWADEADPADGPASANGD